MQVLDHMRENVEAYNIESAEGCALWATDGRTSDFVDLFDRITVFQHCLDRMHCPKSADPIGDKVWSILSRHDTLSQALVQKAEHETRHFGLCPLSANDLDEVQVTWGVEEMDAKKMLPEIFRSSFG